MNFMTIMNQVIVIFMILVIGFICQKISILNKEVTKGLSNFLINVTIPFTIISSLNQELSPDMMLNAAQIFIFTFISYSLTILLCKFIYTKCEKSSRKVLCFITVFSNCAFMGFPVLESIFGSTGVFYGSIYLLVTNIFMWTYGQILFTEAKDFKTMKKAILSPPIIAIAIGLVICFMPYKLPTVADKTISMMGSLTTPLSMLIIGAMLTEVKFKEIFSGFYIYYGTLMRLILLPLITLVVLKALHINSLVIGVCVLLTAMPASANSVIMAESYDGDAVLASSLVFLSTIISIITIPLFTLLL